MQEERDLVVCAIKDVAGNVKSGIPSVTALFLGSLMRAVSEDEARASNRTIRRRERRKGVTVDFEKKSSIRALGKPFWLGLAVLLCSFPGWSQQPPMDQKANSAFTDSQRTEASAGGQQNAEQRPGSISGKVVDQSGVEIEGAVVTLKREGESSEMKAPSNGDGLFAFTDVPPGPFQLTISSEGLASQEFSGTLESGETLVTPLIMLVVPTQVTEVVVGLTREELADVQIKEEEKQRVLGIVPNFYLSYDHDAAPLRAKHKFELAWKSASDPVTLVGVGFMAGIDQAADRWGAYGQGAEGYAKRYGATYANVFVSTFVGGAVMPSLLKQDPRYFYKGTGSRRSRIAYALASSVICKGDNGRWQPNYSNVIGSFAGAGMQVAYLPANDRRGSGFVVSSALIRLGETSLAGVLQEFVFSKLTPNRPRRSASQP